VLLKGLADHFGGELGFHIAQALDGFVAVFDLGLVFILEGGLG
jgi:hypothetical protein